MIIKITKQQDYKTNPIGSNSQNKPKGLTRSSTSKSLSELEKKFDSIPKINTVFTTTSKDLPPRSPRLSHRCSVISPGIAFEKNSTSNSITPENDL